MKYLYPIRSLKTAREYEDSVLCSDPVMTERAMKNAGLAVGRAIYQDFQEIGPWPEEARIMVLCGKGLNTGDALVACGFLKGCVPGLIVKLVLTAPESDLDPLAAAALGTLRKRAGDDLLVQTASELLHSKMDGADVVIDALYGLGFQPPLREEPAALLRAVNGHPDFLLRAAIDLPSGVGESLDEDSFVADFTYIPGVPKSPCFDLQYASHVGRIRFLEVDPFWGTERETAADRMVVGPGIIKELGKLRPSHSDKRTFGHCLVIGGSRNMPGAVVMASLGALHGGVGLLTTAVPAMVTDRIVGTVPESMWRSLPVQPSGGLDVEAVRRITQMAEVADACLIGPGLVMDRPTTFVISRVVRETPLPLVLDASALTQDVVTAVLGRSSKSGPVIITPHMGEFSRISGCPIPEIDLDVLTAFSKRFRTVTLLKGSPNWISDGDRVYALPVGGPVLARGGSGDILAGIIAALLAKMPDDPLKVLCQAVSWHGAAADSLAREKGSVAVRTTELLPHLAACLR